MKKILIANDDGIKARGIHELAQALSEKAEVYVIAPNVQRSAAGHGIMVRDPISVEDVDFKGAKLAYQISGLPADCVKLGLHILKEKGIEIDMVFSGINHGGNLGTDTLYSGTVAAAIEGNIEGKPSIAVSVNSHTAEHFDYATELAVKVFEEVQDKLSSDTVLNINVPNIPYDEVKGVKITTLGNVEYDAYFKKIIDEEGKLFYKYTGSPILCKDADCLDVVATQSGYATITPLNRDYTDYSLLDEVKKWRIEK